MISEKQKRFIHNMKRIGGVETVIDGSPVIYFSPEVLCKLVNLELIYDESGKLIGSKTEVRDHTWAETERDYNKYNKRFRYKLDTLSWISDGKIDERKRVVDLIIKANIKEMERKDAGKRTSL